jgi:hypothetical protein
MPRRSHLKEALKQESRLRDLVRAGTGAIKRRDLTLIVEAERPRIGDSLDLDAASRDEHPEANRWDYIISIPDLKELAGVEPHTAKDSEISVVVLKKRLAIEYLRTHLQHGHRITRRFWVSHGPVGFSRMDRARRRLDQNGIAFVGRKLRSLG